MAKVVRNIEITEAEAQILVTACALIDSLTSELEMTSAYFFEQLGNICDKCTTARCLGGEVITDDDYDNYEFKIVDK